MHNWPGSARAARRSGARSDPRPSRPGRPARRRGGRPGPRPGAWPARRAGRARRRHPDAGQATRRQSPTGATDPGGVPPPTAARRRPAARRCAVMPVSVITDSAAALPPVLVEQFGVRVVPLWLYVGRDSYRDGELELAELVDRLDEPFSTAAPSPFEFSEAIASAGADGPVVVLTVASTMSSTHDAAVLAAREADVDVTVVDTRTAAGAQGLVVLEAARVAAAGAGIDGGARRRPAGHRSGAARRDGAGPHAAAPAAAGCPRLPAGSGARVGAQPLFELRAGRVRPMRPAFGRAAALDRIVERCATARRNRPLARRRAARPRSGGGWCAGGSSGRPRTGLVLRRVIQPGDGRPHRCRPGRRRLVAPAVTARQGAADTILGAGHRVVAAGDPLDRPHRRVPRLVLALELLRRSRRT